MDLSRWMADLSNRLKQIPIYELLLPGSHDSAAINYIPEARFEGAQSNKAKPFGKLPCVRNQIEKWMKTQELDLFQQLNLGIRKLDLRISYDNQNDLFYFSHTFASLEAETGLKQIRNFLRQSPGEVLYIECNNDHANRQTMPVEQTKRFLELVQKHLGSWLVPNSFNNRMTNTYTLENLISNHQQVFFIYRAFHLPFLNIWQMSTRSLTIYTSNLDRKWEIIEDFLADHSSINNNGRQHCELALTLTPETSDVVKSIFNPFSRKSVKTLTDQIHSQMYTKLEKWNLRNINSLATDFVDRKFVNWVIQYNLNRH